MTQKKGLKLPTELCGAYGGAVGGGMAPQGGWSPVPGIVHRLSLQQKCGHGIFPGKQRRPVLRAVDLTAIMYRLSENLGASTYLNTQGLSKPVQAFTYICLTVKRNKLWL